MAMESRSARLWWSVPAASILILVVLAMLFGKTQQSTQKGTSYDASFQGFRAAYLLLQELGYPVVRSSRPTQGAVRWVLFPRDNRAQAAAPLDAWVRNGGILIFADDSEEFAHGLGMNLKVVRDDNDPGEETASGPGVARLQGGNVRVEWPGQSGRAWAQAGPRPIVTVYEHGPGQIWLINRPEVLTNHRLSEADNAILLCRLADDVLDQGSGRLEFDEFYHGMRDRPGVLELLLQPPTVWITAQGVLLIILLLYHYVPRFGTLRNASVARRRSQEEFLDAMASLLERKGDCAEAYQTARDDLVRELERGLGLPPGTEAELLVQEVARRKPIDRALFQRVIGANLPSSVGKSTFVKALNELETARDEFFHGRRHR